MYFVTKTPLTLINYYSTKNNALNIYIMASSAGYSSTSPHMKIASKICHNPCSHKNNRESIISQNNYYMCAEQYFATVRFKSLNLSKKKKKGKAG